MFIVKNTSSTEYWHQFHKSIVPKILETLTIPKILEILESIPKSFETQSIPKILELSQFLKF